MGNYSKLKVWETSHYLTIEIYKLSKDFPADERFGITSQMRRAAYSVPANIVEGNARKSRNEFKQFLSIARGSIEELSYFLLLSKDLNYINIETFEQLSDRCSHIASMLNNLIKKI